MPTMLPRLVKEGYIKPNATVLFEEGTLLERVRAALELLKENKGGGKKVVVKVEV